MTTVTNTAAHPTTIPIPTTTTIHTAMMEADPGLQTQGTFQLEVPVHVSLWIPLDGCMLQSTQRFLGYNTNPNNDAPVHTWCLCVYVSGGGHTPPGHGGAFSERVPEKPLPLSVKERVQLAIDKYRQVGRLAAVACQCPAPPLKP